MSDPAAVAERAAALLLEERLQRPERPLGLATGRTMAPVFRALARRFSRLPADEAGRVRSEWCSFNLDEYIGLESGDPRSFTAAMERDLVAPLGLDPRRVRLPDGRAADPAAAARRYAAEVERAGGIGLQLLGLGLNGHVGFNEPPCGPEARCRCVRLRSLTRRQNAAAFGGDPAAVPERAITLGLAEILAAERILLVVTGAAKAPVLRRVLQDPPTPDLPASWLQRHPAVTVLADDAALGR
ncbi:MAG: 6-phosphogluconolactonase [Synechococcaceae cyanobacterium]|nr:6-phosphogluconolactonase [Synechococcaceae cyanobacterium]